MSDPAPPPRLAACLARLDATSDDQIEGLSAAELAAWVREARPFGGPPRESEPGSTVPRGT